MKLAPKKILIVLHGSLGDVTRAIPLANLLRRGFPAARIAWSIEPAALPLVERHPAVDEVILFDRARWRHSLRPFLDRIRASRFDLVLDLQRHLKSGLISRWSGAPERVGFNRRDAKEMNWLFNNRSIPPAPERISKLNHYLNFAEYLGLNPSPVEWNFRLSSEEESAAERLAREAGGPFAAYLVGGRWESKRWFPDQAAESAAEVKRRHGLAIVLLGGKEDADFAAAMERQSPERCLNLTGRTSLREVIGILRRAEVAVGPDSGLMHLSAAVGTPVVSLWGPTDPLRTGPFGYPELAVQGRAACAPCYLKRCPIGRVCMRSIRSEEVLVKVGAALSIKGKARDAGG
ncbi:MAG TPA: glycosyltransferase family 9 protein [Candidatus Binatia bacterium]